MNSKNSITSEKVLDLVINEIEDAKGDNPVAIDVRDITEITDFMLVVGGTSSRHVKAIYDRITELAKKNKIDIIGAEGEDSREWILLDLNELIVHIMSREARDMYQLESLWSIPPD